MARQLPRPKLRPALRTPQQDRSRRTRQEILAAAMSCFEQRGYDETTTAAIARKAGIAVGTLYGYFRDKREILLEILDGTTREVSAFVIDKLDPVLWRGANPRACVRELIDAVFRARQIQPGVQRILWERFFKDAEFRKAMQAIESRMRQAMLELFQALREEGHLRVSDFETTAFLVQSSVEWSAVRLVLGSEGPSPDAIDTEAAVEAASDMITRFVFRE